MKPIHMTADTVFLRVRGKPPYLLPPASSWRSRHSIFTLRSRDDVLPIPFLAPLLLQFILKYELTLIPDPPCTPISTEPITKTPTETRRELVITPYSENRSELRKTITKKPQGASGNPYSGPRGAISVRSGPGKGVRGPLRKTQNYHAHAIR